MTNGKKHTDKFDKRAANLRANLLKRKEQARKAKNASVNSESQTEKDA